MRTPHRPLAALVLLGVACAWFLGGVAAAVHFHGVAHTTDPATGELVHTHCCDGHSDLAHADGRQLQRAGVPGRSPANEPCVHIALALHAAGLDPPGLALISLFESRGEAFTGSHQSLHTTLALLLVAPKLPPPSIG